MINKLSDNVFQLYFKEFGSCVYLIRIGKDNILIDTSSKAARQELLDELEDSGFMFKGTMDWIPVLYPDSNTDGGYIDIAVIDVYDCI